MLLVIPLLDTFIKYIFLLGLSAYCYGISYVFILKNIFYMLTIFNTFLFFITLFQINYFTLLWDSFLYGTMTANICSFIIFFITFGFLMICDFNEFIDNNITLKIPLINMTYITFQNVNGSYNISLNNPIERQIVPNFVKEKIDFIKEKYNIENIFFKYVNKIGEEDNIEESIEKENSKSD
jgi:hypothetical protein